jgi:hypothetical protein
VKPVQEELKTEAVILRSIEAFYAASMPLNWRPELGGTPRSRL